MAHNNAHFEATLAEVLGEVSIADFGRMLKSQLPLVGCMLVFLVLILVATAFSAGTGFGLENLGVPGWVGWLLLAWLFVFNATSERSYHELKASWYFPKLNWFSSLILAAYLLGFVYLLKAIGEMESGLERGLTFVAVWFLYAAPFLIFLSVISTGHSKLLAKRLAE